MKGASERKTLAGLATNIMNSPMSTAGSNSSIICDGLARSPSIRNISSCMSHVIPSKNFRTSLLLGISALLPMTIAVV